jgi:hypothetical protein
MPRSRTQYHSDLGPSLAPRPCGSRPDPTCQPVGTRYVDRTARVLSLRAKNLIALPVGDFERVGKLRARCRARRRGGQGVAPAWLTDFCAIGLNCADSSNRIADCCCYWGQNVGTVVGGHYASHSEIQRRDCSGCAGSGLAIVAQVKADVCANRDLRRLARRSVWRAHSCEARRPKSLITELRLHEFRSGFPIRLYRAEWQPDVATAPNGPVLPPVVVEMAPPCSAKMPTCSPPAHAICRRQPARWGEPHRPTADRPSAAVLTCGCLCNAAAGRTTASSWTGPLRARAGCDDTPHAGFVFVEILCRRGHADQSWYHAGQSQDSNE